MKAYSHVRLERDDYPLRHMSGTPVAIEFNEDYVPLPSFAHPQDAVYVFGPEDGSLTRAILSECHHFVTIPSGHCLNLAMAVNVVLYDRMAKNGV
jgi:tRNA(Leu) C34 or U34 (ribose-2'-O)-methylase TrmL